MDKYIGKRLDGRYVIKDIIGVGGMACVYRAYDSVDDRVVAVKILKEEFLTNEDFIRRFKNESKAIAILSHPNIVKVLDVGFGDALQYIVMEYIDGITLKEYIDRQHIVKWKEAVHFTVQILRALQHAHDKGIVHRDIKPQNIMLLPDGTIKVTDFGIARFSRTDIRATALTDQAIGSVHYISPEQARGELTDEKADIYSVGVMMYEMLTGQLPFEADNAVSVAIMQLQSEPRKPREVNPDIPEGLEDITIRAMQKDPAKRYQSAAEMLHDIDKFKQDPSIHFAYTYFQDETPTRFVETVAPAPSRPVQSEPEEEESRGIPVLPILAAIAGACILVALIFVGILLATEFLNPDTAVDEIDVPHFEGKLYEEIINDPRYTENFTFEMKETADDLVTVGYVVSQLPQAGHSVKKGKLVTLYVSTGKEQVNVPDVVGHDQIEAENAISRAGLRAKITFEVNHSVPIGQVIRTEPKANERISVGSDVRIYVSSGMEAIEVPRVIDSRAEVATATLKAAGFISAPNVVYQNTSDPTYKTAGIVMDQSPAEGEKITPDMPVTLYVSSGYQDVSGVYVELPDNDSSVQLQVFIGGLLRTEQEYTFSAMIANEIKSVMLNFHEQKTSYPVMIKISVDGGTPQKYLTFTVNGVDGTIDPESWMYYELAGGPTEPTGPEDPTGLTDPTDPSEPATEPTDAPE
ncbi:MAG: Stk1 family PASTA domain-containing Ser/Thr kinase [Clostridia bacterium]|nr:Stk1 family PASTA domain-containing Ser/Thr kinase [Clostridia bacterium]